jgi:hypothetical protein
MNLINILCDVNLTKKVYNLIKNVFYNIMYIYILYGINAEVLPVTCYCFLNVEIYWFEPSASWADNICSQFAYYFTIYIGISIAPKVTI